jgi:DUF1680 family protein
VEANGPHVLVNGIGYQRPHPGIRYLNLERNWKKGDKISLTLPNEIRMWKHAQRVQLHRHPARSHPTGRQTGKGRMRF